MLSNIVYYIKTTYRWLLRCRYSRGFGIQSPSAYSFACQVINDHSSYEACVAVDKENKNCSKSFRKLGKLFFRLTQYWKPKYVVMGDYAFASYIYAGYEKALVRKIGDCFFDGEIEKTLMIVDIDCFDDETLRDELFDAATDRLLLVLIGIHKNSRNRLLWNQFLSDARCGVSYDLYTCGIIFFDKTKYKQVFKINF